MERRQLTGQNEGIQSVENGVSRMLLPREHQGSGGTEQRQLAIPLCLPNNWEFDPHSGKCHRVAPKRSTLTVNQEALKQLKRIKGPVCVVSIAGKYRIGKSFVLSEAFDQPDVFPLGHEMVAETVGIWLWIVPEKYKDSHGQEFTIVLLDSEGIKSAATEGFSDHQIFTLVVLLANVLIFNSQNVPTRDEVEELDFIAMLSKRIQIRSSTAAVSGQNNEGELFHQILPYFVWLLRDAMLAIPSDCTDLKDYFLKKVFQKQESAETCNDEDVAGSILRLFPGFDAFSLPPPTYDPDALKYLKQGKSQTTPGKTNPLFWSRLQDFKYFLKPFLAPKRSCSDTEFVTGEGLAALVQSYTEAINTPGAIPNVQKAWDTFVGGKFSEATEAALVTYDAHLTPRLSGVLPCNNETIRLSHDAALQKCQKQFMADVYGISTDKVEFQVKKLKQSIEKKLQVWQNKNNRKTREFCQHLFEELKKCHLDPVLQQLQESEGAKLSFDDVIEGYKKIKDEYEKNAKGAEDVIAAVFYDYHEELKKEEEKNLRWLKLLKNFDDRASQSAQAEAYQKKEIKRLKEQMEGLMQENREQKNEMEFLMKNLKEEKKRFDDQMEDEKKNHREELDNMKAANRGEIQKVREAFIAENDDLKSRFANLQFQYNEEHMKLVQQMSDQTLKNEKEKEKIRQQMKEEADKKIEAKIREVDEKYNTKIEKLKFQYKEQQTDLKKQLSDQLDEKEKEKEHICKQIEMEAQEKINAKIKEVNETCNTKIQYVQNAMDQKMKNIVTTCNAKIAEVRNSEARRRAQEIEEIARRQEEAEKPGIVESIFRGIGSFLQRFSPCSVQ